MTNALLNSINIFIEVQERVQKNAAHNIAQLKDDIRDIKTQLKEQELDLNNAIADLKQAEEIREQLRKEEWE